jgi:hypothetical protein
MAELLQRLRTASDVFARAGPHHNDIADLLLEAALAIEHLSSELHVQRGMAIASQTLAEQLSHRLEAYQGGHRDARADGRAARASLARAQPASRSQRRSDGLLDERWASPYARMDASVSPLPFGTASAERLPDEFGELPSGFRASAHTGEDVDEEAPETHIDALVASLKLRFRQSGVPLPLAKQQGSVYRLGSRRVNLAVHEGRLTVRSPAGEHTDLLEYLSKSTT